MNETERKLKRIACHNPRALISLKRRSLRNIEHITNGSSSLIHLMFALNVSLLSNVKTLLRNYARSTRADPSCASDRDRPQYVTMFIYELMIIK